MTLMRTGEVFPSLPACPHDHPMISDRASESFASLYYVTCSGRERERVRRGQWLSAMCFTWNIQKENYFARNISCESFFIVRFCNTGYIRTEDRSVFVFIFPAVVE